MVEGRHPITNELARFERGVPGARPGNKGPEG